MSYARRPAYANALRTHDFDLHALGRVIPPAAVDAALAATGRITPRVRKLTLRLTLWLVIAMTLWSDEGLHAIMRRLLHTLRLAAAQPEAVPRDGAIAYRRRQLGVRPLWHLFRRICRPLATPQTPGAFLGGLRLMAIDGTLLDVPDTPAHARTFGYSANQVRTSAFPQVKMTFLVECGTHAIVDAVLAPRRRSEQQALHVLARSLTPGMLLLLDRGLHSYPFLQQVRARGGHVLGRLPANITLRYGRVLPDGSRLADLVPVARGGRTHPAPLPVRLITYTLDDPQADGTVYRLLTTLLDAEAYPAQTLAHAYHERWEAEGTLDEVKTHLHAAGQPLRSQTSWGVVQELYGLLLAHYAVRALIHQSACEAGHDPDRVSFTNTVHVVRLYIPDAQAAPPWAQERLQTWLRFDLRDRLLPPRRPRANPRVVKRRRSNFPTKQRPPTGVRLRRPLPELIRLI